jgi:hypothetical protein
MKMEPAELDRFLEALFKCKTYKEVKQLQKDIEKKYSQDDVIRAVMATGRESELAQATAFARDLMDKEPMTKLKIVRKKLHRIRHYLYYHQTLSWFIGFLMPAIPMVIFEVRCIPDSLPLVAVLYLLFLRMTLVLWFADWFRNEMHKVE